MKKFSYLKRLRITAWHVLTAWSEVPDALRACREAFGDIFRAPRGLAVRIHGVGLTLAVFVATVMGLIITLLIPFTVVFAPVWLWFVDRRVAQREDFASYYGNGNE